MKATQIREELHQAIDQADDRLLNLIYAMVQADLSEDNYALPETHKDILEQRLSDHKNNYTEGSSWEDVKGRIKRQL